MGVIRKRVDDYLYNSKGEEVEGAEKVAVSIPGIAFGGTRAKKHELDMSAKGKKAHDKEREKVEEQTRQLWANYLKYVGFSADKNAPKSDTSTEPEDAPEEPDSGDEVADEAGDAPESQDNDLSDEDLEAATNPSGSGFGSNY